MTTRGLFGFVIAVAAVASALPAEAGHRRCRTCASSGGYSQGNWFHFTSGRGAYVPFATETVAAPVQTGPPVHYGGGMTHHRQYQPAAFHSGVRYVRPGCRGCAR